LKAWIGRGAYVAAFARLLLAWPRPNLALRWDGNLLNCEAVYVAKGRYFAGPWTFAPQARSADALFHVVAFKKAARRHFVRFAWRMLRGRPVGSQTGVHMFCCTALTIEGDPRVPLQADGDIVARLPTTISINPKPTRFH
jgi:diacylglycerol kinase family enzyme